jgi:hypothetical protein
VTRVLSLLRVPLALTIGLVAVTVAMPGRTGEAFRVYILALVAYGLARLVAALYASRPVASWSPVDSALQPAPERPAHLEELERIEREIVIAKTTSFDLHFRLRPTLRRIASELLRSRRGLDLDGSPDAARDALGEETWELVRRDRPPPADRFGPGIDSAALQRVVDSLEAI